MSKRDNYSLTYITEYGEKCHAKFHTHEYHSLMELLFDKYMEEWGDCKGKAWCGTCHIKIIKGSVPESMDVDERHTLSKIGDATDESRLACQIPVTAALDDVIIQLMGRN